MGRSIGDWARSRWVCFALKKGTDASNVCVISINASQYLQPKPTHVSQAIIIGVYHVPSHSREVKTVKREAGRLGRFAVRLEISGMIYITKIALNL